MATTKNEAVKTANNTESVDDVMAVINAGNLDNADLSSSALAEIEKEKDESKKNQLMGVLRKAQYQRMRSLLGLRKSNKIADIEKWNIRVRGRLERFLGGFTVDKTTLQYAKTPDDICKIETCDEKKGTITITVKRDGKESTKTYKEGDKVPGGIIDVVDYDNYLAEIDKQYRNKKSVVDNETTTEVNKLDASFGNYWSSSWRYNRW